MEARGSSVESLGVLENTVLVLNDMEVGVSFLVQNFEDGFVWLIMWV